MIHLYAEHNLKKFYKSTHSVQHSRQALAIDIYGAKSIVNQMKVQTINELYNAYCEACKRGAEHLFQFRRKLENALSSKLKAVQVIETLEIIQNRQAMNNWIKPGEDGPKTKAQQFMDFKLLTLKRNKAPKGLEENKSQNLSKTRRNEIVAYQSLLNTRLVKGSISILCVSGYWECIYNQ